MDRAYVTCHMVMSLDGKIDGEYHDAPNSEQAGKYYYDVIFDLGSSMAGGRVTTCMYSPQPEIDYGQYRDVSVPEGDFIVRNPAGHYCFVYDRTGKCQWDAPTAEMNGVTMQIVEVLTCGARPEYLAHLRKVGIAYIFVDEQRQPVKESLEKMKSLFGVGKLVLTGGAAVNGGFLAENAIDELSIVLMPYVEGKREEKALMDTAGRFIPASFGIAEAKILPGGAVHLIFKRQ